MRPARDTLITGRIAYRGGDGTALGEERFELCHHAGGHTLRATCELDDIGLLREVSMTMDAHWHPLDAFSRIIRGGRLTATNWFSVDRGTVRVESRVAGAGRVSQHFDQTPPITYIGLHPLQGDALITTQVPRAHRGGYHSVRALTNSVAESGDQGLYAVPVSIDVACLGEEALEVAAGTFTAEKFALRWSPDWPPAHLWVRRGSALFLKLTWSQISNWYELVELHEDGP